MEAESVKNESRIHKNNPTSSSITAKAVAVRSAEKKRVSSCSFADRVAQLSMDAYKQTFPVAIRQQYDQTVLAAVLLQIPRNETCQEDGKDDNEETTKTKTRLIVVSLGVGTKVVSAEKIFTERQQSIAEGCGDRIVRDMHAEVLARRGFLRFLINTLNNPDLCPTFFHLTENGYVFRSEITVHLYSSSQPCGNACDKRWAKGKQPKLHPDLTVDQWPVEEHEMLSLSHVLEGQIAVTVKTNIHTATAAIEARPDGHNIALVGIQRLHKPQNSFIQRGNVLSCSDKIAVWMTLGMQGSLLLSTSFTAVQRLAKPIYLSTITVGRKYSAPHAQRAFCCRVTNFSYPPQSSQGTKRKKLPITSHIESTVESLFNTHHPSVLCTAIKFDVGSLLCEPCEEQAAVGARFNNQQCLVAWCDASSLLNESISYEYEILDGRSGLSLECEKQTTQAKVAEDELVISRISSYSLHEHMLHLQSRLQLVESSASYLDVKNGAVEYQAAKKLLRSQQPFDVWTGNKDLTRSNEKETET